MSSPGIHRSEGSGRRRAFLNCCMIDRKLFLTSAAATALLAVSPSGRIFRLRAAESAPRGRSTTGGFTVSHRDNSRIGCSADGALYSTPMAVYRCSEFTPVKGQRLRLRSAPLLVWSCSMLQPNARFVARDCEDATNYLRQEVTLSAMRAPLAVRNLEMVSFRGCPTVWLALRQFANRFQAHVRRARAPRSRAATAFTIARISLSRKVDVEPGVPMIASMVSFRPSGQLRRSFLTILSESARPIAFLHYNSW